LACVSRARATQGTGQTLTSIRQNAPMRGDRSGAASPVNGIPRRPTRSRASSLAQRFGDIAEDEPLEPPSRQTITSRLPSGQNSPRRELPGFDLPVRPMNNRSVSGFEGPTSLGRESSAAAMPRLTRVPTEPTQILASRSQLRVTKRNDSYGADVFGDDQSDISEAPTELTRTTSYGQDGGRKMPPPPPPSRAKKPPPPPPMKRSALSTSEVPHYPY